MGRRDLLIAASVLVAAAIVAVAILVGRGPGGGPLQPSGNVNSFGLPADDGSTVSLVVELRGEHQTTAKLREVSLASPDPGLALVGDGILVNGYPGTYIETAFPLGPLAPLAGATISTDPADHTRDVFLNLGIRVSFASSRLSVRGVWLDYDADGASYRALLPWLLTLCETPVTGTCVGLRPDEFSFPPH
jgi:hypothetical protein